MSIQIYTERQRGEAWLARFRGQPWSLGCVLGFTETALIPGISAAGQTPSDRRWTALADAEFLAQGLSGPPRYPLPPLTAGVSPVLITRALVEQGQIPVTLLDAGLPVPLSLPPCPGVLQVDLQGQVARCVSTGAALPLDRAHHLLQAGLAWGTAQAARSPSGSYWVLGECVVGGTTSALAVLLGLGVAAQGRVNSSHPHCNHGQKAAIAHQGLKQALGDPPRGQKNAVEITAAVGDPMQLVVAGMAIALSPTHGVLLAGGTQMLAVYAIAAALMTLSPQTHSSLQKKHWNPDNIAIGTTRWVAADPSGDTPGLARAIGDRFSNPPPPILLATDLDFSRSRHRALRAYEAGFVKEGVAAGGSAIATSLATGCSLAQLQEDLDEFCDRYYLWRRAVN